MTRAGGLGPARIYKCSDPVVEVGVGIGAVVSGTEITCLGNGPVHGD